MDDFEQAFEHFPFLPGVDLTLWVQVFVIAVATLAAVGAVVAFSV